MYQRTGCDREDKSGPGIAPTDEAEMAVTMARTDVAMRMWRLPLVPRETDELPSPTDRKSLWIFIQHGCSAFLAEGSKPVRARLASSNITFQRRNNQVKWDVQNVYEQIRRRVK